MGFEAVRKCDHKNTTLRWSFSHSVSLVNDQILSESGLVR